MPFHHAFLVVLMLIGYGVAIGCASKPRVFASSRDELAYLQDHPEDWEAQEQHAEGMGPPSFGASDDPWESQWHLKAMKSLAPYWRRDENTRGSYIQIEQNYVWSLPKSVPAIERLSAVDQLMADRHSVGRWVPGEPQAYDGTLECADLLIKYSLVRGYAFAELGRTDEATASFAEAMPVSIRDLAGKAALLQEIVDINRARATKEDARGNPEEAKRFSAIADTWETARRETALAEAEADRQDAEASRAQAERLHAESLEMLAESERRAAAERERLANLVPCPVCHGYGELDVELTQIQERHDGPHREVVGHSSQRCIWCTDGWVTKERAEEIRKDSR